MSSSLPAMNWALPAKGKSDGSPSRPVTVNAESATVLLEDISRRLAAARGFTVATLNLDHVVKLRSDPAFRDAYARHTHVVADGNPIVWLGRISGQKLKLAPGSELVAPVIALAAQHDVPAALVGATEDSLARAAEALRKRHPGLRIVARIAPPMGFDPEGPEADRVIDQIAEAGARLCFLALGAPRQEIFAARAHDRLDRTGFLSVGAGLDFISGAQHRAPPLVRRLAAEWLWRLASNPRRLGRRYAACIGILPSLTGQALRARGGRS